MTNVESERKSKAVWVSMIKINVLENSAQNLRLRDYRLLKIVSKTQVEAVQLDCHDDLSSNKETVEEVVWPTIFVCEK